MISKRSAVSASLLALAVAGAGLLVDLRADRREALARADYPPGGLFVEVEGRRVHYVQDGSGPDLVLIHGASGNTRDYTFGFMRRLTGRYRVTAFDRPGLGYTDLRRDLRGAFAAEGESPQSQAALLAAAAAKIGIESPIVLGHSYGGAVAMAWALDHPASAIVDVSGATEPWPGGLGLMYDILGSRLGGALVPPLVTAFVTDGLVRQAVANVFAPQEPPEGYLDAIGAGLTLRRASFRANARQVATLRPHVVEMSRRYPEIDLPLEIVHGTADTIVPIDIHSEVLVTQVKGANLARLPGVGHMPHHVAPDDVIDAIDRASARAGLR